MAPTDPAGPPGMPPAPPHAAPPHAAPPAVPPEAGLLGRLIDRAGLVFAFGFVLSMAVLIVEIVLRHFFGAPTLWAHETTTFLCAIGFVFGGLYCAAHDRHIRVVLLYDAVGPRARRALDAAIYLACAAAACFFAWAAWLMVRRAIFTPAGDFRLETSGSAWNPPTPALLKLFLLAVLVVMAVQFVVLAIRRLGGAGERDAGGSGTA